jgi:hypothetical protein
MSWTPKEFELLIKGAQHCVIDDYEKIAKQAMANRYAQNAKHARENKIFNAARARRKLEAGTKTDPEIERMVKLNETFKGFKPDFRPKGG